MGRRLLPWMLLWSCTGPAETDPGTDSEPVTDSQSASDTDTTDVETVPFDEGPYGTGFRDIVGPFELSTTQGSFSFEEAWTGQESFIFLQFSNDPAQSPDLVAYLEQLWLPRGHSAGAFADMFDACPRNFHLVISSFDADAADDVQLLEEGFVTALDTLRPKGREYWSSHTHFVTTPVGQMDGWIGELFGTNGWLWFGVDRAQQLRQLGSMTDFMTSQPSLANICQEATFFAFEAERQSLLDAEEDVTIVPITQGEHFGHRTVDIELPANLDTFDKLEIDVGAWCPDHLDSNCGAWDYKAHLYACDVPDVSDNAFEATSCDARVPEVPGTAEVLGTCPDGVTECMDDAACGGETCTGYVAPIETIPAVPAETLTCACSGPVDGATEGTQTCREDGSGFDDCACPCGTEVARWITTYGREGRWVTDMSPFLGLLKAGNTQQLRFAWGNPYTFDAELRLSSHGTPEEVVGAQRLWSGGGFNAAYNDNHPPIVFEAPEGTTRVELVAFITGHGWGAEVANCAEFCNHTHHFGLNGSEWVKTHEIADDPLGCMDQVSIGVVPNQYGSWPFGRAGWCPGLDVPAWTVDITDAVEDGENTLTYEALFNGGVYQPQPSNSGQGFGAQIDMVSYLVFYKAP